MLKEGEIEYKGARRRQVLRVLGNSQYRYHITRLEASVNLYTMVVGQSSWTPRCQDRVYAS
jgi:hypothetical protein